MAVFQSDASVCVPKSSCYHKCVHTHKFLVYYILAYMHTFGRVFHALTWKKSGSSKLFNQGHPPSIARCLRPVRSRPGSPRARCPARCRRARCPGLYRRVWRCRRRALRRPGWAEENALFQLYSFNRKIHEFPLHQLPFFSYSSETRLPSAWGAQMPGQMPPQMPSQLQQMYVRGSGWCMLSWVDREESETSEPDWLVDFHILSLKLE